MIKYLVLFLLLFTMNACVGLPPIEEYNLAHLAINTAKAAGGEKYNPGIINQAEETYQQALKLYGNREYEKAKEEFIRSRKLAEKAEVRTRVKKYELGETF